MISPMMKRIFWALDRRGFFHILPDKTYIKLRFQIQMGRKLDLKNPKSMNEKLQWMKLYDRDPKYTVMVDKLLVRDYIAKKIGEEYLIPLLGVWDDPNKIDFDSLPEKFVLKCNHNSGLGMCICKDKSRLDVEKVRKELRKGIRQNYYLTGREWPYKNVPRRIICEQYMTDGISGSESEGLTDYKFYCFGGRVDYVVVCIDRHLNDPKFYFFDREWKLQRLNARGKAAPADFTLRKPACMDKMFDLASELSKDLYFVRVDLYECGGKIYFGELTFFPDSGYDSNRLRETDELLGELIDLTKAKGKS